MVRRSTFQSNSIPYVVAAEGARPSILLFPHIQMCDVKTKLPLAIAIAFLICGRIHMVGGSAFNTDDVV